AMALNNPRVYLDRDKSGQWNVGHLLKEEKPAALIAPTEPAAPAAPAEPQGFMRRIGTYIFRGLELSNLVVHGGELFITEGGQTRHFSEIDLTASLSLVNLGQPEQKAEINIANLGITTPRGRFELESRLTYSEGTARISSLNLKLGGRHLVSLTGEVCRTLDEKDGKAGFTCALTGNLGLIKGDQIHDLWPRWPASWDLAGTMSLSSTSEGVKLDLQGKIGAADYLIKGTLDTRPQSAVFELDLDLKGLTTDQLKEIQDLKTQPLQGLSPVNAHLHLQGTGLPWNPESLETRLDLSPFRYRDLKVDKVHLELSGNAGSQKLQASVAGNFGSLELGASGHLLPVGEPGQGLSGNLTMQTKDLQPAMLGVADLSGSNLTTSFKGKFRLPPNFSLAQLSLAGNLKANG
ncbi:MAG TPA: hypothetical protein VFC55_10265, partial [Desulfobaccales bacterium]|nr:hypothetical protein [Desulfobaccales bacterium]